MLKEQAGEIREYSGDADDKAHDETWKKLEKRRAEKKKWKTLVMPDPEAEGEIAQEDFDKKQKERGQQKPVTPQSPTYQSPLVRKPDDEDAW